MGKFRVEIEELADEHFRKHFKSGDKASIKKIKQIVAELAEHPFMETGKPELLRNELSGFWSRRINKKDRLIYRVEEDIVFVYIISAMGHYNDK